MSHKKLNDVLCVTFLINSNWMFNPVLNKIRMNEDIVSTYSAPDSNSSTDKSFLYNKIITLKSKESSCLDILMNMAIV